MTSINNYIKKYRQIISNKKILENICILISAVLSFFLIASLIEEIFYLSSFDRRNYMILLLSISVASILFITITWIINYFALLQNNSDENLAYKIGYQVPQIKDRLLNSAVYSSYQSLVKRGEYPFFVINIQIPYEQVDVNVHPMKTEVRFHDEWRVYHVLKSGVSDALSEILNTIPNFQKIRKIMIFLKS